MWVYDEDVGMNCREVTFVPGLYKIFDEILGEYLRFNEFVSIDIIYNVPVYIKPNINFRGISRVFMLSINILQKIYVTCCNMFIFLDIMSLCFGLFPSFPSQLEWKIGLAWANTRGSLNSPS